MAALSRTSLRPVATRPRALVRPVSVRAPAALPPSIVAPLMELAEGAPGTVDAPISVVIGGAIVVTLAATALIPIWLNPGQEAADKIFASKENKPSKTSVKNPKKGK